MTRGHEIRQVEELGNKIGYGNMMNLASKLWGKILEEKGCKGGEFIVGPCKAQVVACGCKSPASCDWCCGTNWLTRKVKNIKELKKKRYSYISEGK